MSLVSVSNLLSPFRSKAQTVGLLVLAFLVFVVRWVGSSDSQNPQSFSSSATTDQGPGAALSLKELQLETAAFLDSQARAGSDSGNAPAPLPGELSLDEQLAYRPPPEEKLPGNTASGAGRNKDLADIRKSLGIE